MIQFNYFNNNNNVSSETIEIIACFDEFLLICIEFTDIFNVDNTQNIYIITRNGKNVK